jgi:hypothetical protein
LEPMPSASHTTQYKHATLCQKRIVPSSVT